MSYVRVNFEDTCPFLQTRFLGVSPYTKVPNRYSYDRETYPVGTLYCGKDSLKPFPKTYVSTRYTTHLTQPVQYTTLTTNLQLYKNYFDQW